MVIPMVTLMIVLWVKLGGLPKQVFMGQNDLSKFIPD
jgi:hypothetical protein